MPKLKDGIVGFAFWDWKEQPDWDEINKLLKRAGLSPRLISFDDIGDDQYYLVVVQRRISKEQARRWLEAELHA